MAHLTKEEKRDAIHGFLILLAVIVVLGILVGTLCFGEADTDEEDSKPFCETDMGMQVIKTVDELIKDGVISLQKPNSASFVAYVDPDVWRGLKYEQKQTLISSLERYTLCQFKEYRVVYVDDAYSGKRLGKSRGLKQQPKIYSD